MRKFMESTEASETEEKDHSETLKTLDKAAIEDATLVASVQERMDKLTGNDDVSESETADSDVVTEDSTPDVKDDSTVKDTDQAEPEEKPDGSTPEAEKKDDSISIPEAYIRAAIHQGWDKEVVDDFVKTNPELAKKAFQNCYNSVNQASREWSNLGRAKVEQERESTTQTATEAVAEEDPKTVALIAKLRKEYADDPLVEVVIKELESKPKPVKQQPVSEQRQHYEVATARATAAGNAAIDQRINTFFSSDVLKPYEKFYGKLDLGQIPEDLTNGQQQNRLAVLEEANFITIGHNMRGQKIEVEQALDKAHLIVTEHIREQVVRDNLKATATKRKKSMTLRPSDSTRSASSMADSSKPRNKQELEHSVQQSLDKVFKR